MIRKRQLYSSALAGLIISSANIATVDASISYDYSNNGDIINGIGAKNDLPIEEAIVLRTVDNITFNTTITTHINPSNLKVGALDSKDSTITFNNDVTVNKGFDMGIYSINSTMLFNAPVITNNNRRSGIHSNASPMTFKSSVTANENNRGLDLFQSKEVIFHDTFSASKNNQGININRSKITFDGVVTSGNNTNEGIVANRSTLIFNKAVIVNKNDIGIKDTIDSTIIANDIVMANENISNGIDGNSHSDMTFNGVVTANQNGNYGIHLDYSTATFKAAVTTNKNSGNGIALLHYSTATFEDNVTVKQNNAYGINLDTSTATFNGAVVANENNGSGVHLVKGLTIKFNSSVTANENPGTGIYLRDGSATFEGDITANKNGQHGILFSNSTATFNGHVTADDILLDDQGNKIITFGNGAADIQVSAPIITGTDGENNVTFNGSATGLTIAKAIGEDARWLQDVRFTSLNNDNSNNINLAADVYSREIRISDVTLTATDNITLTSLGLAAAAESQMHLKKPILNLNDKTLTLAGVTVHDDANADIIINTTFDGKNAGHIAMASADDSIDLTNSKNLVFNITEAPNTPLPLEGAPREVDMFVENGGALTLNGTDKTIINSGNQFVIWSFNSGSGVLTQTRKAKVVDILQNVVAVEQNDNVDVIANNPDLLEDILNIAANEGGDAATQAIERLTNSDAIAIATAPVNLAIQESTQVVSNRAETMSGSLQTFVQTDFADSNEYITGVSAGSEINKYGAWVSPVYGISKQGSRNNTPGYKSSFYGIVLGFDALINDKTALGVALSAINTDIKHKHQNAGDRTKADSYIFSGYGTYEISKEWFVQGVGSIGRSKIKNTEIRNEFGQTSIASASYNATSWGVEALTGYNQKIRDNLVFTPLFGFEFNRLNGIKYKETGTRSQNLSITRKGTSQLEAILGARLTAHHTLSNITLVPEIHGNIRYGLLNKKLDVDIRQDGVAGASLVPRSAKQVKSVYNIGFGMNAKTNDKWEYAIGYDVRFANKYVSHQGTMKVRLNF